MEVSGRSECIVLSRVQWILGTCRSVEGGHFLEHNLGVGFKLSFDSRLFLPMLINWSIELSECLDVFGPSDDHCQHWGIGAFNIWHQIIRSRDLFKIVSCKYFLGFFLIIGYLYLFLDEVST